MKIHDLKRKQDLEVDLSDLLVIEDEEDTKAITAKDLLSFLSIYRNRSVKKLINETIDRVIEGLEEAKYKFRYTHIFETNVWIGSPSGNIQVTIYDPDTQHWLTQRELAHLLHPPVNEVIDEDTYESLLTYDAEQYAKDFESTEDHPFYYEFGVVLDGVRYDAQTYSILSFKDLHPEGTNEVLEADNAGFIKFHIDNLTQNQISEITAHSLVMPGFTFKDENDCEYYYGFQFSEQSFINTVPYIVEDTPIDEDWPYDKEDNIIVSGNIVVNGDIVHNGNHLENPTISPEEPDPEPEPTPEPDPEPEIPDPDIDDTEEDGE